MTFVWTSPDPLNNTAKTRSIYITELQDAVNVKRAEIGLVPIIFIDQQVGKKFRLDAIEELKTVTNNLAILYGYPTGIQDPALLGRPYVTITKKFGKEVAHYPIINDLRMVLNLLVEQYPNPIVVSRNWVDGDGVFGNPSRFGNFEMATNPLSQDPVYYELPSTLITDTPYATDISIIFDNKEGPIGGPYNTIPGFGSSDVFDDTYFYEIQSGGAVYRWKRDGSSTAKELVVTFSFKFPDYAPLGEENTWEYITVDGNYIYAVGNKSTAGPNLRPIKAIYGRSVKTPGSSPIKEFWYDANACNAEAGPFPAYPPVAPLLQYPDQHVAAISIGRPFVKNGKVYVAYRDRANYYGPYLAEMGWWWYVGSCIVEITQAANGGIWANDGTGISRVGIESPSKAHTSNPWIGPTAYYGHNSILTNSNNYIWMAGVKSQTIQFGRKQDGTFYPPIPPVIPSYFSSLTYGGSKSLYTKDYDNNDITASMFGLDTVEAYALRDCGPTSTIVVPNFTTATRIEGNPNDTINVSWPQTNGVFNYRIKWGTNPTAINFVGATIASNLLIYNVSFNVPHGFSHYVKLELLTGQGDLLGSETIEFQMPIPPAPILLSANPGTNSGDLDLTWTTGSPWVVIDGFIIYYKKVGDIGPWSSIDVGLVGAYTLVGLIPGASYDVKVRVYNDSGYSELSNMLVGVAKL